MLSLSADPTIAERQMHALIFYLTTFGYIDGDFDSSEREFVRSFVRELVVRRITDGMPDASMSLKRELTERFTTHFEEVFEVVDAHVAELFTEATTHEEDQDAFIHAKLKLRCFEIIEEFSPEDRDALLSTVERFILADGSVHPAEKKFRDELAVLLDEDLEIDGVDRDTLRPTARLSVESIAPPDASHVPVPLLEKVEEHYSADHEILARQADNDTRLIARVLRALGEQRDRGAGKLRGKKRVDEFAGEAPFLDGHVYVHPALPEGPGYELTVLGDLHGCYSCLKATLMQSRFFDRIKAYESDPTTHKKPLLVLLGDYIDRGRFSLNGVLRAVMELYVAAPEYVFPLRGNHEYYVEYDGSVYGGVKPAESINTLKPHLPSNVFRYYITLFESLPNMLIFEDILFVHAGIPRDRMIKQRWEDLSSLNDPDIRFQMMWSDPSSADVIPASFQELSARFPFGRLQAASFLNKIGCTTLIRGHEKVKSGFMVNQEGDGVTVMTLFSSGGATNADLPDKSSYRKVRPKAMTLTWKDGETRVMTWPIDYSVYNDPTRNRFFATSPEIKIRK